jgi:hypothetical protein
MNARSALNLRDEIISLTAEDVMSADCLVIPDTESVQKTCSVL